jgi:hypothetical protein
MTDKKEQPKPVYADVHEVLHFVQKNLKVPKLQENKFGGYKFRSCEDIVEGVKGILPDGATLKLTDKIVLIGDRYYVQATASLCFKGQCESVDAYAREELAQKGMSAGQLTGATSSYARKYALNGLFMIDDTRDADATNDHGKAEEKKPEPKQETKLTPEQEEIKALLAGYKADLAKAKTLDEVGSIMDAIMPDMQRMTTAQVAWINGLIADAKDRCNPMGA